jgi:hypothetical protein
MARRSIHEAMEKPFQTSEDFCKWLREHSLKPSSLLTVVAAILKQGLSIKVESWSAPIPEWPIFVPMEFEQNPAVPPGTAVAWTRYHDGLWLRASTNNGKEMVYLVDAGKEFFAQYMQNAVNKFESWMLIKLSYMDPGSYLHVLAGPDQLASVLYLYTLV